MRVFDDPLAVTRSDPYPYEQPWQTIGSIHSLIIVSLIIVVIHTWPEEDSQSEELVGRIISARKSNAEREDGV